MISPDIFIPLAEATGLVRPIGRWVMDNAAAEAQKWGRYLDGDPMRLAINVSADQFRDPQLIDDARHLVDLMESSGIELEFELTESMVMREAHQAAGKMNELRSMGFRLAMDDFGTGYSSLTYIRNFPFNIIKIDRSFVADLGKNTGAQAIIRAIVLIARSFDLDLIAEGVETADQAAWLAREGCPLAQGYHFSRPLPASEFCDYLQQRRGVPKPLFPKPYPKTPMGRHLADREGPRSGNLWLM
jgi:EAL domain-containing protein (putative c-di-GMP-specific phosphodiesterase class I)